MRRKIVLEIEDILDTSDRGVRVVVKETGRAAWLPRAHCEFFSRRVAVPAWLAQRLLSERDYA